ncbi:MAG: hypothetical protein AB7Q76_03450 [Gammaproteobacteria bacterium]
MNDLHLALHGLAIKKHAAAKDVAGVVGLDPAHAESLLRQAVTSGRCVEVQQAFMLSPSGRMILEGQYSRLYDDVRADRAFLQANDRFERINTELKQLVTDWQVMEVGGQKVRNDHSNADYDARILDRLGDLHERFTPVLNALAQAVPRLRIHLQKLEHALERSEAGATEWVSDAKIESYHTVWFEMHEDLLRIVGRERAE